MMIYVLFVLMTVSLYRIYLIYCDVTIKHFWYGLSGKEIQRSPQDIMIGIKSEETLLNYLIILGKWYIFTSARKIKLPKINALIAL